MLIWHTEPQSKWPSEVQMATDFIQPVEEVNSVTGTIQSRA